MPLTVVLCTHGRPHYLRACLAGLAAQTRRDFAVVVVDSASPAAEAAAIAALAAEAGARLLRAEAPGLSHARNLGLRAAAPGWVAYLDDDAVPEPGWAAALLGRIAALPAKAAALGGRILPAWEAPLPPWWPPSLRGVLTIVEWEGFGEVGRDLPAGVEIYGANMAFARAPLLEIGGFPEALGRIGDRLLSGEEVEVVARLRARGFRAFYDGAAAVRHSIQRERLRPSWLLSRLLWQGATDAMRDRRQGGPGRALGAAARLLVQAPLLLWPAASPALLRARCGAAYNLGYLRGRLAPLGQEAGA
ncbi:glycosyltransferase family 2 protein [Crenalkalicoccus roseus]|uniref:glycosyltransferase family 2 protein n=1 Tax=Crenalkalicoccus roseus TaxID=1485588 RepID=UPI001081035A|nr:glycosyltransferase family 2 protein [Crenalkalicoccus roseus]